MTELVQTLIPYVAPSALPLVVVIILCYYIYRKTMPTNAKQSNKNADELTNIRDKCLSNENEIRHIHDALSEKNLEINELRKSVGKLDVSIGVLSTKIDNLTSLLDRLDK